MPVSAKDRQAKYRMTPRGKYAQYKHEAKQRRLQFNLSFKQFVAYWKKPCWYCGYEIKTIGLDRVNNDRGYLPNNIIECCALCNGAKSKLKQHKFLALCSNVVRRHGLTYAAI